MYKTYMGNPKSPETETDKATAEPEAEAAELFEFFGDCEGHHGPSWAIMGHHARE